MANTELGAKQVCPTCQTKFYDLGRRPAVCPKCGSSFDPEEALRSRRVRARSTTPDYEADEEAAAKPRKEEDVEGFEDEPEDTPEIDQAAEAEPLETEEGEDTPGAPEPEPDLGVDFEEDVPLEEAEDEDVPFLEEEDEDFPDEEIEGLPEEREP